MGRATTRTDAELIVAAGDDPAAFRELYERHAERIHGYLLRRTRDADAALDLTAETFARVWECRPRFRDEAAGSAAPWLFGIARNVLLMSVRRGRLERDAARRLGLLEAAAPVIAPQEDWLDRTGDLLAELPDSQQRALALRVGLDLDYQRVATALGTSVPGARVRVHRGLAALRRQIQRREVPR